MYFREIVSEREREREREKARGGVLDNLWGIENIR
jgi:hypothetical protein